MGFVEEMVERFNIAAGKFPLKKEVLDEEWWEQVENAAMLVLEETKELLEAVENKDIQEVLDASCDIRVVRAHLDTLLESVGVDTEAAILEVCRNNMAKIAHAKDIGMKWLKEIKAAYPDDDYEMKEVLVGGNPQFPILRKSDNKLMKPVSHKSPNIGEFIPDSLKEA